MVSILFFCSATQAQKKFVYEDTALLQQEEVISAPVEEFGTDEVVTTSDDNADIAVEPIEPDTVLNRNTLHLPYDSVKSWKNLKAYDYMQDIDSLLRAKNKVEQKKEKVSSGPGFFENFLASGFLSVLLWSLAILFVGFIIYRLFLAEGVFQRKPVPVNNAEANVSEEEITHDSDFEGLIKQALLSSNYRQAVRYQYLRTLHGLASKQFVDLAPDKTNFQYVREIGNPGHQQAFAALTLHYEYVWYGEFDIGSDIYHKIEKGFLNLNQKL